ncbi:glycosyltransferase family 4 protein [Rickenella mellea]|uniref:Alpha-1,3/1,6-mannosyltransferase ALG2 n=1 Tax=Rickenella mellea TaxID=50990 RepID=A0A4Y7PVB0_9AGAM|nr:glycosyltransferase family 4 protein [Rickenella mellea]
MSTSSRKLRIAFIHPDLGIGGAERLVVDAALGLQNLGHSVDIYTSHHDPSHCFEETRDGTLRVHYVVPPFPRSLKGKLHILFAHLRQLHLTQHLMRTSATQYDVFFVDQLSTCIPLLRLLAKKRVVFYCHFPDKLLANGEFVDGNDEAKRRKRKQALLKRVYRFPMDWLEEKTTEQADILLANSQFTARVFNSHFSIPRTPRVVYPGINISAYDVSPNEADPGVLNVLSDRPTLLSLNRFEQKKNAALAVEAFAILRAKIANDEGNRKMRLVVAGGYDPRVTDNINTLDHLVAICKQHSITYHITSPKKTHSSPTSLPPSTAPSPTTATILFLLNFTTSQRSALLTSPHTLALLYTPTNEHFGIGPVEGMVCGLPVLACDSGGPTETVLASPREERTGWLVPPSAESWADALEEIVRLPEDERREIARRARIRARERFGMDKMARDLEEVLQDAVGMGRIRIRVPASVYVFVGMMVALVALVVRFFWTRKDLENVVVCDDTVPE